MGPKASIISATVNQTVWRIKYPSTAFKSGKVYFATTYPNSDLIYIETAVKHRQVSQGVATKITAQIRASIEEAK